MQITFLLPLWLLTAWKWSGAAFAVLILVTAVLTLSKSWRPRWFYASLVPFVAWLTFFVAKGLLHWP